LSYVSATTDCPKINWLATDLESKSRTVHLVTSGRWTAFGIIRLTHVNNFDLRRNCSSVFKKIHSRVSLHITCDRLEKFCSLTTRLKKKALVESDSAIYDKELINNYFAYCSAVGQAGLKNVLFYFSIKKQSWNNGTLTEEKKNRSTSIQF